MSRVGTHINLNEALLFEITAYGLDRVRDAVIEPVRGIADPEERLRSLIRLHIEVVLSPRDREITVMLHENHPLPPALRKSMSLSRVSPKAMTL